MRIRERESDGTIFVEIGSVSDPKMLTYLRRVGHLEKHGVEIRITRGQYERRPGIVDCRKSLALHRAKVSAALRARTREGRKV